MSNLPSLLDFEQEFKVQIAGNKNQYITGLAPLDSAKEGQLAFLVNPLYRSQALLSKASCLIVNESDYEFLNTEFSKKGISQNFIIAKNPYAVFARIAQWFIAQVSSPIIPQVHPTAFVDPTAKVPWSCYIGPFCHVSERAVLGERVYLQSHVSIGDGVHIGSDTKIMSMVSIYKECKVGQRGILHSGVVIGSDGFGFAPDFNAAGGEWVKIPQTGRVLIGDDVEIGANTAVDRGAMADTVIENGCKIDNLVQIAHNVRIGAHSVIAGCAALAGSTVVGKMSIIGGSANLAGHLSIAERTTVSGGTSITRSIKEAGQHFTSVFPFTTHVEWEKNAAIVRGLDKLRKRIKNLEKN